MCRKPSLYVVLLSMLLSTANALAGDVQPQEPRAVLDKLLQALNKHQVSRVEIVQMNVNTLTRIAVSEEMLDRQYDRKLTIAKLRGDPLEKSTESAIQSVVVEKSVNKSDFRLGARFFVELDKEQIISIYFDKSGNRGSIDGIPVVFKGLLFKFLDGLLARCAGA